MEQQNIDIALRECANGDRDALERLMPVVYGELRRLAHWHLRSTNQTLQPTALVHEVYLRLVGKMSLAWQDRTHFFASAAQIMRRVLVDYRRTNSARKRGGRLSAITLDESSLIGEMREVDFVDLNDALDNLATFHAESARIVELRFFVGLSEEEIAEVLGISLATVKRRWQAARAWIQVRLAGNERLL